MPLRIDAYRIDKSTRTPEGFLKTRAPVTRVGVFTYRRGDGSTVRELRSPEEVFQPDSMMTLSGKPLTDNHPQATLDSSNAHTHLVGYLGESIQKRDVFVDAPITVIKKDTITAVENGKCELSCGYMADLDPSPGVFQGEAYDVIQRNIRYNHVSIVDRGRMGAECRLRIDAADAILTEEGANGTRVAIFDSIIDQHDATTAQPNPQEGTMEKITIDGKEVEVSSAAAAVIKAAMVKADAAKDTAVSEAAAAAKKTTDTLQAKVDSLEAEKATRKDTVDEKLVTARVQERLRIEKVADKVLKADQRADSDDDLAVMKKVIKTRHADAELDGKSTDYIRARFDILAEAVAKDDKAAGDLGAAMSGGAASPARFDNLGNVTDADLLQKKRQQTLDAQEAWKTTTNAKKA